MFEEGTLIGFMPVTKTYEARHSQETSREDTGGTIVTLVCTHTNSHCRCDVRG